MSNVAIIVEGGHDASFIGQLLKLRGFRAVKSLNAVPKIWNGMFPTRFPVDGNSLERVIRFPEIYTRDNQSVGIVTAGSDNRLVSTLRATIDAIGSNNLGLIALFIDIDAHDPAERFSQMKTALAAMNTAAVEEKAPGYPISIPNAVGVIQDGTPKTGIYMFPDNPSNGSLETILLDCAGVHHSDITEGAIRLVDDLDRLGEQDREDLRLLRAGMGMLKAKAGIVANLFKPGTSLAASLAQTNWLKGEALETPHAARTIEFVDAILRSISVEPAEENSAT